jgi:hypothetical protein
MGSIKNDKERVVITLEIEKLLKERARMIFDGHLKTSTNITVEHAISYVLWSLLFQKIPQLKPEQFKGSKIDLHFDKDAGAIVMAMEKQH